MLSWLMGPSLSLIGLLGMAFWIWMLVDCIRNDPDRGTWLWILFFFNIPAAVVYFIVRKAPSLHLPSVPALRRWQKRREIWAAEAAAQDIGKAHQFGVLGAIYRETGQWQLAQGAYGSALAREPDHMEALWGISLCMSRVKDFEGASRSLERLLKLQPTYAYGEASLAYARTLARVGRIPEAISQLERHLKDNHHPQARVLLGELYLGEGRRDEAASLFRGVIQDARSAPDFHVREARRWARRARKLLGKLPGGP